MTVHTVFSGAEGSRQWESYRQRYIRGSEDLCFWCGNQANCPYWEYISALRMWGNIFVPDCPFIAKEPCGKS